MKALFALLLMVQSCGPARVSEPVAGPTPLGPRERQGQVAFMHTCNGCHPQGEAGLGGALNSKPLTAPILRAKVRGMVPGDMPKFGENEVSDDDLDAIGVWLATMRKKR